MVFRMALVASVALAALGACAANAAITVSVAQAGGNVVFTSTGSINTSALTLYSNNSQTLTALRDNGGYFGVGADSVPANIYSGFTGPSSFGGGTSLTFADSFVGTGFSLNASPSYTGGAPVLIVDKSYSSGSMLTSSATYNNATFASLGLTAGTYVYTATATRETITLQVGPVAAVPEPASWAMMITGFGMIGAAVRRRKVAISFA